MIQVVDPFCWVRPPFLSWCQYRDTEKVCYEALNAFTLHFCSWRSLGIPKIAKVAYKSKAINQLKKMLTEDGKHLR